MGDIHIKPSHRGRLTELKKRTGKSEAELYNDGNPAHKKMVVFARNARKWNHADGGYLTDPPAYLLLGNKKEDYNWGNESVLSAAEKASRNAEKIVPAKEVLTDDTLRSFIENTSNYFTGTKYGLKKSPYRPTVGDEGEDYYTRNGLKYDVLLNLFGGKDSLQSGPLGSRVFYKNFDEAHNQLSQYGNAERTAGNATLGSYGISAGKDDNGRYISFHDIFDYKLLPMIYPGLHPYHIYDRIYENEADKMYNKVKGRSPYDTELGIMQPKYRAGDTNLYDLGGNTQDAILYDYFQSNDSPLADTLLIQPQSANTPAYAVKISGDAPEPVYMPMSEPMSQPIQQPKTFTPAEVTDRLKRVAASAAALSHLKKTLPVDYIRNYRNTMNTDTPAEYAPSEDLIQYLISTENFLERPDNSLDGKWTIGYGDTDKKLNDYYLKNKDKKYTRAEAEKRLRDRVANEFLPELKKSVPNWDRLTPAQKDSLLSYAYNAGKYFVFTHKNFASAMRDFDLARAASELNAGWNQKDKKGRIMTGIRKRRLQEQYAFTHPDTVRFGQAKADGGLLERLDKAYEGDAQAMLEAVRKARDSKL